MYNGYLSNRWRKSRLREIESEVITDGSRCWKISCSPEIVETRNMSGLYLVFERGVRYYKLCLKIRPPLHAINDDLD